MTYYNAIRLKTNEMFDSELTNASDEVVAYRVPEDAEHAVILMFNDNSSTTIIRSGDTFFGGKDLILNCDEGYYGVYLDLNTYIQRSGEHKGCVVIENDGDMFRSQLAILEK